MTECLVSGVRTAERVGGWFAEWVSEWGSARGEVGRLGDLVGNWVHERVRDLVNGSKQE